MREQLYRKLTTELQRQLPGSTKPQTKNLALLTQALVFSPNCHVNNLALELPIAGRQDSLINRLRRFLDNCHITRYHHYFPLVRKMFAYWPDKEVGLVMDRTDIERDKSILLLGVAFKHRVVPLTWRVLPFGGTGAELQESLLREIKPYLPSEKRVMFYGDSEFRAVEVQRYCRQQKWGWQVGVKSDTLYHQGDGQWQALKTIEIAPGERRYVHHLTLTKQHAWPDVHLLIDWSHRMDFARYVICHQPTNKQSWRRGRKRFWIEPTFRDWKSYGFDLEATCLVDDRRLDCLLLGMAVATLWLLHLGDWVTINARAPWLTANHRRDYSLFRLGRDYARRSQLRHWELPVCWHR